MRLSHKVWRLAYPFHRLVGRYLGPPVSAGGCPRGIFSEAQLIREDRVEGAVVLDGQFLVPIPADSEIRAAGLSQDEHTNWRSVWTRHDACFLAAPSLAHMDSKERVCTEAIYGPHGITDPVWRRKKTYPLRRLSGDFTSMISRWNMGDNYYHWFMDGLSRLIHLNSFPPDCRILVPRGLPPYAKRSLEILGLEDRLEETTGEDLKIERYWFAGPTMLSGCPDPAGAAWIRSRMLPDRKVRPHRLLYIDRVSATRTCSNAAELRRFFIGRGWDIVDPGAMILDEQIKLFASARGVVGIHGAALTNLLWMTPGSRLLELMPSRRRNGCYAGLAMAVGIEHKALVQKSNREGVMHVSLQALAERVQWFE